MKSPFEIRSDILKQAQDHLEAQYEANVKFATDAFFTMVKEGNMSLEAYQKQMPKFPTADEVMAQATKFYSFVTTK